MEKLAVKIAVAVLALTAAITAIAAIAISAKNSNDPVNNESMILSQSSDVSSEEISSLETSSEEESSDVSSEPVSSKEDVSSNAVSSKATSSKAVSSKPVSNETSSKEVSSEVQAAVAALPNGYLEKYANAYSQNKALKGELVLPNGLRYYVPQASDNAYYLDHNFQKQYSAWGVPYVDCRVSITDDYKSKNIILYGHSDDKRVLQLSILKNYRYIDFYKQNPTIEFNTVYGDGKYKIVAFFIENTKPGTDFFGYHMFINQTDPDYINNYIEQARLRSYIDTTVDVLPTDEFLTISTCQDTNLSNYNRYVLLARKVRDGESSYVDVSSASKNSSQKLP